MTAVCHASVPATRSTRHRTDAVTAPHGARHSSHSNASAHASASTHADTCTRPHISASTHINAAAIDPTHAGANGTPPPRALGLADWLRSVIARWAPAVGLHADGPRGGSVPDQPATAAAWRRAAPALAELGRHELDDIGVPAWLQAELATRRERSTRALLDQHRLHL